MCRGADLLNGLLLEPVLGLLLVHLGCIREIFDGRQSLPVSSGAVIMPARRADSFLSTSIEICEVYQQPHKPPTCGSHRLRKLSSCRPEVGLASQLPCGETHCGLLISPPELERLLRDIDHGVGQRAGDFEAAGRVPGLEHCKI